MCFSNWESVGVCQIQVQVRQGSGLVGAIFSKLAMAEDGAMQGLRFICGCTGCELVHKGLNPDAAQPLLDLISSRRKLLHYARTGRRPLASRML